MVTATRADAIRDADAAKMSFEQNDEVGEHAGLDRSLALFVERSECRDGGKRVDGALQA